MRSKLLISLSAVVLLSTLGCTSGEPTEGAKRTKTTDTQDQNGNEGITQNSDNASKPEEKSNDTPAQEEEANTPPNDMPPAAFTLTSSAFQNNQRMPDLYVAKNGGGNQSPPLQWAGAPAETASFAIQMVDLDFRTPPFIHWLITDIPAGSTQLPTAIPAGSNLVQPPEAVGANQPSAYRGPNPPNLHRYEFTIYAIKPGETLNLGDDSALNKAELEAKSFARSTITGTYD